MSIIEGLKIQVSSEELEQHLRDRAAHHAARREFYLGQARNLDSGIHELELDEEAEAMAFSNSGRGDPRQSMRAAAKTHEERQAFFTFLADHIVQDVTYQLTESEFLKLEYVSRYM